MSANEFEASAPTWLSYVVKVLLHFWHNHKVIGTALIGLLTVFGAPVWLVGVATTALVYVSHAHTAHKYGSFLWNYRGCLMWAIIVGSLLLLAVMALFGFAVWDLLVHIFH